MHVVVLVLVGLSASASEASSHSLFSSTDLGHAADKRLITPLFGSIVSPTVNARPCPQPRVRVRVLCFSDRCGEIRLKPCVFLTRTWN